MAYDLFKSLFTEFLGTFILIFIGGCAAALSIEQGGSTISVAVALGLALVFLIYTLNQYSGANFNPAISFGLALTGRLGYCRMILYWLVQILGAVAGGALVMWIFSDFADFSANVDFLNDSNIWKVVVLEMFITAFLVFVFLIVTKQPALSGLSGFIIGTALIALVLTGNGLATVGANPAFSIGLAIFRNNWTQVGFLILGNFLGVLLAWLIYKILNISWTCAEAVQKGCNMECGEEPFAEMHRECNDGAFIARGYEEFERNKKELEMAGVNTDCLSPCEMVVPKCEAKVECDIAPARRGRRRAAMI